MAKNLFSFPFVRIYNFKKKNGIITNVVSTRWRGVLPENCIETSQPMLKRRSQYPAIDYWALPSRSAEELLILPLICMNGDFFFFLFFFFRNDLLKTMGHVTKRYTPSIICCNIVGIYSYIN